MQVQFEMKLWSYPFYFVSQCASLWLFFRYASRVTIMNSDSYAVDKNCQFNQNICAMCLYDIDNNQKYSMGLVVHVLNSSGNTWHQGATVLMLPSAGWTAVQCCRLSGKSIHVPDVGVGISYVNPRFHTTDVFRDEISHINSRFLTMPCSVDSKNDTENSNPYFNSAFLTSGSKIMQDKKKWRLCQQLHHLFNMIGNIVSEANICWCSR